MSMEHFARVYEKSQGSDRKNMTKDEWDYLELVDRLVNG